MNNKDQYQPPFTITPAILNLVAEIGEAVGRLSTLADIANTLRLRRINRIRTIRGSLAIEGNTLSEAQITAILEGKRILAPPREVLEVRNAIAAYDRFEKWRPGEEKALLEAHRILMTGLIDEAGVYRRGGVGVMSGNQVIHMAPPAGRVSTLMRNLLHWLRTTDQHPLVTGSVFHYEFEFIHPFTDGNGRIGRLWQTLILTRWNPLFAHIPVESLVHQHQEEYYKALQQSTQQTDSAPFIDFMLRMTLDAISAVTTPEVAPEVTPEVKKFLDALRGGALGRREIQTILGLKDEKHFRMHYQQPAISAGLIEMTIPGKPKSRLQKYRLTDKGRLLLENHAGEKKSK